MAAGKMPAINFKKGSPSSLSKRILQAARPMNWSARYIQTIDLVSNVVPILGFFSAIILSVFLGVHWFALTMTLVLYVIGAVGVEVGYHRYFSHGSFKAKKLLRIFLAISGSMAGEGPVIFWAANHRKHHRYGDRPGDPHSPRLSGKGAKGLVRGLWHAHIGWLFEPFQDKRIGIEYAPELIADPVLYRINQTYPIWFLSGLTLPTILGFLVIGGGMGALQGFLWGGLVRVFLNQQMTYTVNSICHLFGTRPFRTKDRSCNNGWLSLVSLGGSWHNNHHAFPFTASNWLDWWHVDPCYWFIWSWGKLNWVWDVKKPTKNMLRGKRY